MPTKLSPGYDDPDEAELQAWLSEKVDQGEFLDHIEGVPVLPFLAGNRGRDDRASLRASVDAYRRAISICHMLADATLLTDNKSVAPRKFKQMRPDLALRSASGHYMLVELKTKEDAERQGVQELLAYSAAMRVQHPHVNDFVYIIVARHWKELLRFSVLSLIMDGKHVLPLRCRRKGDGGFAFNIVTEIFDFDESPFYSPIYALSPDVLAFERPRAPGVLKTRLDEYFKSLARDTAAECERIGQSGFAMVWSHPSGPRDEMVSLVLATVNQNWQHSEHTPCDYPYRGESLTRLDDVIAGQAAAIRRESLKRVKNVHGRKPDDWDKASANEAALSLYVDSTASADIIEKHRKFDLEDELRRQAGFCSGFEPSSLLNLWTFGRFLDQHALPYGASRLIQFLPFGDLADYVFTGDPGGTPLTPRCLHTFISLMDVFEEHKRKKLLPPAEEDSPATYEVMV